MGIFQLSGHPSQAHSTHRISFDIQLKEVLRLNCGLLYVVLRLVDTVPNPHSEAESVTAT